MSNVLEFLVVAVVSGFLVSQLAIFPTTIYLHRGLAHSTLKLHPVVELPSRFIIWITTGMKPREWAAVHRAHHAHSDQPADPHIPRQLGYWKVQRANARLYKKALREADLVAEYCPTMRADRLDRLFFDHALLGLGIGIGLLMLITTALGFGPWAGLAGAMFHMVLYLTLSGAINAIGHMYGKRPWQNYATNNQWLAWLTAGEGLHNNHHHAKMSPKFSMGPGELDPAWPVIVVLRKMGLVTYLFKPATS